jgi:transcriptional regulator with XRE-family HTH domain
MSRAVKSRYRTANQRIAAQIRRLRASARLTLDALAAKSGVSRSMISLIERGEASPTATVLERLATGLRVPLAKLFDSVTQGAREARPVARRLEQPRWRDPESGYRRRNVSPPNWPSPIRIVAVDFPAGARVAYDTGTHDPPVHQQVWMLSGRISVTLGAEIHRLERGDCMAMTLDRPIAFANRTRRPARYVVVTSADAAPARRR